MVETPVTLTNLGRAELRIAEVSQSCTCFSLDCERNGQREPFGPIALAPGESATVIVRQSVYQPAGDSQSAEFSFQTNDPDSPANRVVVRIASILGLEVKPRQVDAGTVLVDETMTVSCPLFNNSGEAMTVEAITFDSFMPLQWVGPPFKPVRLARNERKSVAMTVAATKVTAGIHPTRLQYRRSAGEPLRSAEFDIALRAEPVIALDSKSIIASPQQLRRGLTQMLRHSRNRPIRIVSVQFPWGEAQAILIDGGWKIELAFDPKRTPRLHDSTTVSVVVEADGQTMTVEFPVIVVEESRDDTP
jgi:hypothetical protein